MFFLEGQVQKGVINQNSTVKGRPHTIHPLLEEGSLLWHHGVGDRPVPLIRNLEADRGLDDGSRVASYSLVHNRLHPQCPVPGAWFVARVVVAAAWDSRCLDLGRPSITFTATAIPGLRRADGEGAAALAWTAAPSVVTWLLPKSGAFDSSAKFCFGLQVRKYVRTLAVKAIRGLRSHSNCRLDVLLIFAIQPFIRV